MCSKSVVLDCWEWTGGWMKEAELAVCPHNVLQEPGQAQMACSHHCSVYKHHWILYWLEHNSYARTVPISCALTTMTWHLAPFFCPHGKITLSLLCCLRLGKECSWQPCSHQCHIAWSHSQPAAHSDLHSIEVEFRPILLYGLLAADVNYSLSTIISHRLCLSEWK